MVDIFDELYGNLLTGNSIFGFQDCSKGAFPENFNQFVIFLDIIVIPNNIILLLNFHNKFNIYIQFI